ncbi:MAG: MBL fold metallo-hydrolase [Thermoleophilia bacterium]|nr:MBL fold metallo-hydrolase [Thermoleophilia bacterium]
MAGLRWVIGKIEVVQIVELEAGEILQKAIPQATPDDVRSIDWLIPDFATREGNLKGLVQSFLIRTGDHNILIDTCNGNGKQRTDIPEWGDLQTSFLERLSNAGVDPDEIHVVACSHLHQDHVGWNTISVGGTWKPTFPNARYLFAKREFDHWNSAPDSEIEDDRAAFEDSVRPVVDAGLCELVGERHTLAEGVRFTPSPGHTAAHASVVIESEGQKALISGDFLHHPCQIAHPEWDSVGATQPELAATTRLRLLRQISKDGSLLIGSHFPNPVAGRVAKTSEGFAFMS